MISQIWDITINYPVIGRDECGDIDSYTAEGLLWFDQTSPADLVEYVRG